MGLGDSECDDTFYIFLLLNLHYTFVGELTLHINIQNNLSMFVVMDPWMS